MIHLLLQPFLIRLDLSSLLLDVGFFILWVDFIFICFFLDKSIKVWNARTGRPVRLFQGIFESDITAMDLDKDERNLIVGDSTGKIKIVDCLSGILLSELDSHRKEVSFISYCSLDENIITTSWDQSITVQRDATKLQKSTDRKLLRTFTHTHSDDLVSADFSQLMGLIASGGRDSKIKLWSYEKGKLEVELMLNNFEIILVKFLEPFQLLLSSDNGGFLCLWDMKSSKKQYRCLVTWQNMFNLTTAHSVTAIDYNYNPKVPILP
jgi:WD40 repeat protein